MWENSKFFTVQSKSLGIFLILSKLRMFIKFRERSETFAKKRVEIKNFQLGVRWNYRQIYDLVVYNCFSICSTLIDAGYMIEPCSLQLFWFAILRRLYIGSNDPIQSNVYVSFYLRQC